MSIKQKPFFCSWSGGKDSSLAFYRAVKEGGLPRCLLTMMENSRRSKAHYLPLELFQKQAEAIGVPLISRIAEWEEYEAVFISELRKFQKEGIAGGVFGDIDLQGHKEWVEKVCFQTSLIPCEPLWGCDRKDLLREFIEEGFRAVVVAVKEGTLEKDVLGRTLDWELIKIFEESAIDPSGEEGEYHTAVLDGPIFSFGLKIELKKQLYHNGYWFQDISVLETE